MPPPRKNPPLNAAETIRGLAEKGVSNVGIAMQFKVSKETLKRWLDDYPQLQEAFEQGREIERQALHAAVYRSAIEGKPANVNAFFLLKARFGYVEADNRKGGVDVNVDVKVQNVMVVTDHGSDSEWAAKAAAQQKALVLDAASDAQPVKKLEAPQVEAAQIVIPAPSTPTWMPPQAPIQPAQRSTLPESIQALVWRANG
ncbi:MAG TPA: hypothetical protein VK638_33720 [Edaphobacter sp.]|nr:hypothetical protein [Edaphobacter sp.]